MKPIPPILRRPRQNIFGYGPSGPGPAPAPADRGSSCSGDASDSKPSSQPLAKYSDAMLDKADRVFEQRNGRECTWNEYHGDKYLKICEEIQPRSGR